MLQVLRTAGAAALIHYLEEPAHQLSFPLETLLLQWAAKDHGDQHLALEADTAAAAAEADTAAAAAATGPDPAGMLCCSPSFLLLLLPLLLPLLLLFLLSIRVRL